MIQAYKKRVADYQAWATACDYATRHGKELPEPPEAICSELKLRAQGDVTHLAIDGPIGSITAADMRERLGSIKTPKVVVSINSPGGDAFAGVSLYNQLRKLDAEVETVADGLAASAASVVFMAGKQRTIMEGAQVMIHNARTGTIIFGTADEWREQIADAESIILALTNTDDAMASAYSFRTRLPKSEIRAMMAKETWMNAEFAVDKRFATRADNAEDGESANDDATAESLCDIVARNGGLFTT